MEGASRQVPGHALPAIRKQIDRQIRAAPGRERVGARWAAYIPLTVLIELADADEGDVARAFPASENPQQTLGTSLEVHEARRRLTAAKRSRASRVREAEIARRSPS